MTTQHGPYQGYPYTTPRVTEIPSPQTPTTPSPTTPSPTIPTGRGTPSGTGRYQGYPYTNPRVHDVPSIDAETASRWADLPRKPVDVKNNVVYVDMPEEGSSQVTRSVPGASHTTQRQDPTDKKTDIDENPVIYIDVPEDGCSDVAEPAEPEAEPDYVQETIFYNPFDNRRIDREKDSDSARSSDSDSISSGPPRPVRPAPGRPTPPNTLNLNSPGSSSGYGSVHTTPGLPPSMSKEAYVYRQTSPDDFPLSPIPISEFPQPPPAYTEIESPRVESPPPAQSPVPVRSPVSPEPPRTVVITPGSQAAAYQQRTDEPTPIGLPNPYRKVVYCHHCGLRVHTLVIRQTGTATHVVALTALCVGLFPVTILVYCTDTCKNKNHYCPNCNKMIGYEVPMLCQNMTFTH